MSALSDLVRTFSWEFLGYVVPGFLGIVVLDFLLGFPEIESHSNGWAIINTYPIATGVLFSYTAGFILYILSVWKDKFIRFAVQARSKESTEKDVLSDQLVNSVIIDYRSKFKLKNGTLKTVRNLIMSERPEIDDRVYRFTFRSDFFNHLSTITLVIVAVGSVDLVLRACDCEFLKYNTLHAPVFLCAILLFWPSHLLALNFYRRSLMIPFYYGRLKK